MNWLTLGLILHGVVIFLLRKHIKKFYDSDASKIEKMFLFPYIAFAPVSFGFGCYFLYLLLF
ncbi:hypothetical protein N9804_01825 [Planktomarina temperata]|jgi:hypothetical protein|nr:hypothetical protein [Planktomarina temperata]